MRHRKLLAALLVTPIVIAVVLLALWPQANRVTRDNYARITFGMSRPEVCAILGPPYDYTYGQAVIFGARLEGKLPEEDTSEIWTADGCQIWMYFDREGKVTAKMCQLCKAVPVSLRDKLRWHWWQLKSELFSLILQGPGQDSAAAPHT
jgi:hypothetical protein